MTLPLAVRSLPQTVSIGQGSLDKSFWVKFEQYLRNNQSSKTVEDRLGYARKYPHVLIEGDAQDLLTLSSEKRKHAIKALANLSKYLGCYNQRKDIRERYQLKWSDGGSLQAFSDIFNGGNNLTSMIKWLKGAVAAIPASNGNILLFNALTGLRPDEACHSIHLTILPPIIHVKLLLC